MALAEVRIQNLAIIDSATWQVPSGFTVISGETGSGKSLSIEGLRLALGERPRQDVIRPGADRAILAAVFTDLPEVAVTLLHDHGIDVEDDLLEITRELRADGRSIFRCNGATVTRSYVRELSALLVDITAQGASMRLHDPSWQLSVIDAAGGEELEKALCMYREVFASYIQLRGEYRELARLSENSETEKEEAASHVAYLEPLDLEAGEEERLHEERERTAHATTRRRALELLHSAIAGTGEVTGALHDILSARQELHQVENIDPAIAELAQRIDGAVTELEDCASEAVRYADTIEADPGRIEWIEGRVHTLQRVAARYGSVGNAIDILRRSHALLDDSPVTPQELEEARLRLLDYSRKVVEAAIVLHDLRTRHAAALQNALQEELHTLDLPHASVAIDVTCRLHDASVDDRELDCDASGADDVLMRLSTNPTMPPLPLGEGPSGGELSRFALAVRSCVSHVSDAACIVLDEVDTGIGGATALRVGAALRTISHERQVIAVTHRAEIASYATHHILVQKVQGSDHVHSTITSVAGEDRVEEVARMLSGAVTTAARTRAEELLAEGSSIRS